MLQSADLPETIPLFPLPRALLLPRARLPLHIFEPRYLAMLEDSLRTRHRLIGMVQPRGAPDGGEAALHAIGCAGRVTAFSETEDGRYMVTLTGISRFRIGQEIRGFCPYLKADVGWAGFERDLGGAESDPGFERDAFMALLRRYFTARNLSADCESMENAEEELLVNSLGMLCPFDIEEKQALLEAPSLPERRETLVALMRFALSGGTGEERAQ